MKHLHEIYTVVFSVAVLLFFGLAYPHHLHYQEQFQLFLFDGDYVWEIVRRPGGVADLLGRFCTQFFIYAWVGAAIIALLLSAIQLLMLRLAGSLTTGLSGSWLYGLSFIPSFLLWLFLLDEHALLGGVWAVLIMLLVVWGVGRISNRRVRRMLFLLAIPLLNWLIGPIGAHYYRYPTETPVLFWAALLSAVAILLASRVTKGYAFINQKLSTVYHISAIILFIVMGWLVWQNANFKAERVMAYDFMARYQQWNRILQTIDREKPNNQIGVTVQNLALSIHGRLAECLFSYNQNGTAGLLPDFKSDAFSPLATAEVFYQIGMTNVAQRWVFDAQEAILDFQKSGRCYKRLAETNLINGDYAVARKYLRILQKTLFYRKWANETLPLLGDETAIARHPEYGRLRQWTYKEDFLFTGRVTPELLERFVAANPENRLACEYLIAYYLLTGDRNKLQQISNAYEKRT